MDTRDPVHAERRRRHRVPGVGRGPPDLVFSSLWGNVWFLWQERRFASLTEHLGSFSRPLGVEIRAGLHTGECELVGEKLAGLAVHIGQRVQGTAASGEVLVSQTVKDRVAGSGIEFEERGKQELKGVPGTWRIYAVADG